MKPQLAKSILLHAEHRVKALLGIESKCTFGPFSIVLPSDHTLPRSLKEHPLYDRFLPYLAGKLPAGSTVIDVGANCGDTLASMLAANQALSFACVEAHDTFFGYLEGNIQRIRSVLPNAAIKAIKALVGKEVVTAHMQSTKGSAHAVPGHGGQARTSRTLDEIVRESSLENVTLLKSDVDGFDYDVINSAEELLRRDAPILFFECYFGSDAQRQSYKKTLHSLQAAKYDDWVVFDNYGDVMLRTRDVAQIEQLFEYCWRQKSGRSTRTIAYFDVLCATERHASIVESAVSGYLSQGPSN
jgi:FkbM family methyltransferase